MHKSPPHPEEYGRLTNVERYRALHGFALRRLNELRHTYDVAVTDVLPDAYWPALRFERPAVRIAPRDAAAAPMVFAFTTFPGLVVRFGNWCDEHFPVCGCDACDSSTEDESARLDKCIAAVTAGQFHEAITLPLLGSAGLSNSYGSAGPSRWARLTRRRARELLRGSTNVRHWIPWTRIAPR